MDICVWNVYKRCPHTHHVSSAQIWCPVITEFKVFCHHRDNKGPLQRDTLIQPPPGTSGDMEALGTMSHPNSQTLKAIILTAVNSFPSSLCFHDTRSSRSSSDGVMGTRVCLLSTYCHKKLWKILKEMGIPDHLTWLLRNLYAGQEVIVRTGHGTTDWFQIRKGVRQCCILSPCLFNLYAEYIMRNARLDEAQAGINNGGRNIKNLRYQMTPLLRQKARKN